MAKVRSQVSLALGKTTNGEIEIQKLAKQLDSLYRQVAKRFGENASISIKRENDYERISLAKPSPLPESSQLEQLNEEIFSSIPRLDLPDLLLEIHQITGFAQTFTHISEKEARADDFPYPFARFYWLKPVISVLMMW